MLHYKWIFKKGQMCFQIHPYPIRKCFFNHLIVQLAVKDVQQQSIAAAERKNKSQFYTMCMDATPLSLMFKSDELLSNEIYPVK